MGAQPTKKCRQPAWQSVKGNLIHRCVLAAGGKWLTVRDAARLSDLFNLQEPNPISEARWMAQQLGPTLEQCRGFGVRPLRIEVRMALAS
jgi:hypothetical protein